jgi:hypothetical protein
MIIVDEIDGWGIEESAIYQVEVVGAESQVLEIIEVIFLAD